MTKNKSKKLLQKRMKKQKILIKKINKSIKNKSSLKNCENFCKNDYIIEINKKLKDTSKKFNIPYNLPTEKENSFAYNTCKKTFCNKDCEGYDFYGDLQKQIDFKKKINDGFQNSYNKDKVEMLKKRGALSGCVDIADYDVYHK